MRFFSSKKEAPSKPIGPKRDTLLPVRQVLEGFSIGSRIRYYVEQDERSRLESLIIGHNINGVNLFRDSDIIFAEDEAGEYLILKTEDGDKKVETVKSFCFLLPSDIGEEKKLDYNTRASIGGRGPFVTGQLFRIVSLNTGKDNLQVHAYVKRKTLLKSGIHAGHSAGLLEVDFKSIETFELRKQPRVAVSVPAKMKVSGDTETYKAYILDISTHAMRLVLDPPDTTCPQLRAENHIMLRVSLPHLPTITLGCEIQMLRGRDIVVNIRKIQRNNELTEFEMLDAMELKINLLNASELYDVKHKD